jgi:hypothetical protein
MALIYSEIKFDQVLKSVQEFNEWLIQNGVKTDGSRLYKVIEILKVIVDHYKEDKVSQLVANYDEAILWVILTDATAFMRVYFAFKSTKSHLLPRAKFKEMISGPLLPWDESPTEDNIHGRNILFELEMDATLKRVGLKIVHYDDIQFNFKKKKFNVQCKRIHSPNRLATNVSNAVDQITKRMSDSDTKGLICLSIDKLTGKEGCFFETENPENVGPSLDKICRDFINKNRKYWQNLTNINVLGTFIVINTIALLYHRQNPILTSCRQITLDIIPNNIFPQQSDYRLIKSLSAQIMYSKNIEIL